MQHHQHKEEIKFWLKSAEHDLDTAESLFEKEKYDWCLFLAHLVLEKTLKAFFIRDNSKMPPPVHKLDVLAENTKLKFPPDDLEFLKKVNEFNIQARYPDKKFTFYKICTREFTKEYFERIKSIYQWLLNEIM